jgi:integrase
MGNVRCAGFTDAEPEIYEQVELEKLFAACDQEDRLWFEFFLMTGMRAQEVTHTYWSDILQARLASQANRSEQGIPKRTKGEKFRSWTR